MYAGRRYSRWMMLGLFLILVLLGHHPQTVSGQENGTTPQYRYFWPKLEFGLETGVFDVMRIESVTAPVVLGRLQLNASVGVKLRSTADANAMARTPDCSAGGINLWLIADAPSAGTAVDENKFIAYLPVVLPQCSMPANTTVDVNIAFDVSDLASGNYLIRADYIRNQEDAGQPIDTAETSLAVLPESDRWSVVATIAGPELRAMEFVDGQNGWISAHDGAIYHSDDGGLTWETQRSGFADQYLWDLDFVDQTFGWVAGKDVSAHEPRGILLFTLDGGQTWQPAQGIQGCAFKDVNFVDHLHGWVIEEDCEYLSWIWRTSDGGQSWTRLDLPDPQLFPFLHDVAFVDSRRGWLATMGLAGGIVATDDGAESWTVQAEEYLYYTSVDFVSTTEGWIGGYDPLAISKPGQVCRSAFEVTLWHTVDAGEDWDTEAFFCGEEGVYGSSGIVSFADAEHGMVSYWVADVGDIVVSTLDRGQTWSDWFNIDRMNGLQMVTPDIACAIRADGTVLKFER